MKLKYFNLAKRVSKYSNHPTHHLGAVVVKKNRVLSTGFNSTRTHTRSPNKYKMLHAEIDAIISVNNLAGAVIYVYRETKAGELGLARPCTACYNMLKSSGIKRIFYTTKEGYGEELL